MEVCVCQLFNKLHVLFITSSSREVMSDLYHRLLGFDPIQKEHHRLCSDADCVHIDFRKSGQQQNTLNVSYKTDPK